MNPLNDLVVGKLYRIQHRSETQRFDRYSIMRYLGSEKKATLWDARPVAGTQKMPNEWIISVDEVVIDTPIVLNQRAVKTFKQLIQQGKPKE